jgi:hypothetical protein
VRGVSSSGGWTSTIFSRESLHHSRDEVGDEDESEELADQHGEERRREAPRTEREIAGPIGFEGAQRRHAHEIVQRTIGRPGVSAGVGQDRGTRSIE